MAIVGNFTGDERTAAVAAVGANSPIISLIVNLFVGIALGANVVIANAIGRGDREAVRKAVHTSVVVAVIGGFLVSIAGELAADILLRSLNVPDDVFPLAMTYLRIYLLGMPVILLYNFEAAIFRSIGDTKVPLLALAVSGVLNVLLNLFFVAVLHMTVDGVAIATVISNAISSVLLFIRLLFLQYMTGYDKFHGDYKGMQSRYYEFANWFFCSPFMAQMRDVANRYSQNTYPYPMFGLIYGKSKAGKTTFLKTLLLMMIGQQPLIRNNEFTRTTINNLRCEVKGSPIIVDDLVRDKFNQHAVETIKNDYFGYNERMVHYPAVVISANEDVKSVGQEVIRRTVICQVQAGLTNTELMSSNMVKKVQKNIGTAFYREYLRRMLEYVPDLIDMMKDDECDSAPDIMKVSSEVMYDILSMYSSEDLPFYVRKLTMDDYFSERVTGKQAIQAITIAWRTSRNCFVINKNANELRYNAGQSYDADRIIRELPETLEATKSREWIIMRLDEAKKFFGIKFSNSLWSRIKK